MRRRGTMLTMIAAAALAACSTLAPAASAWPDECAAIPGYSAFRAELEAVAAARDPGRFRALVHPGGSMRVNGIGGRGTGGDWGFDRPQAASVWKELDALLGLGCARRGDRLFLPAMAALAEDGAVSTDVDMALTDVTLRAAPDADSAVAGRLPRGGFVTTVAYGDEWVRVLAGEREAYVAAGSIRSPHGYRLVLTERDGRWGIAEFGDGV